MEKKTKIILGIVGGLVAAAGIYIAIAKPFKKKEDEAPAVDDKSQDTGSGAGSGGGAKTPVSKKAGLVLKKATQKVGGGFNTGTTGKPAAPVKTPAPKAPTPSIKPISSAGAPEIGTKVYAYANTNTYKEGKAKQSAILHYNKKGTYLGTYLGSSPGGFSRLIVEDKANWNSLYVLSPAALIAYGVSTQNPSASVVFVKSSEVFASK
jgi:hypothetical protein